MMTNQCTIYEYEILLHLRCCCCCRHGTFCRRGIFYVKCHDDNKTKKKFARTSKEDVQLNYYTTNGTAALPTSVENGILRVKRLHNLDTKQDDGTFAYLGFHETSESNPVDFESLRDSMYTNCFQAISISLNGTMKEKLHS